MRATLFIALIALTACGGKKHTDTTPVATDDTSTTPVGDDTNDGGDVADQEREPPPKPEPAPPRPPDLTGIWVGPCSPTAADPKVNGTFTFTFADGGWTLDMQRFSDAACTKRTWAIQGKGTYEIGEMSAAAETGAWNADITLASYTLTADDKATAKKLAKTCGVKLTAKKALDITAKGCPKLMIRPVADCGHMYEIVMIDGGELHFGAHPADNDTCTEDKRPAAIAEHGMQMRVTSTGLPDCDAYAARVRDDLKCEKLPQEVRDALMDGLREIQSSFVDVSGASDDVKKQSGETCKQSLEALDKAMEPLGC